MKAIKIILSKTLKLPIQGVNYSNRVVSATVEYEANGFTQDKAWDEINQLLEMGKDEDQSWIKTEEVNKECQTNQKKMPF